MATKTWTQTSGNLWSTGANWSGGTVPATTDTIVFDNTSDANCTIDNLGTWTGGPVSIASGYDGTITQNTGVNFTCTTFSMADDQAVFTCHAAATFTSTTFAVSAGTFNQGGAFVCTTFGITATGIFVGSSAAMTTTAVTFSGTTSLTATSGTWNLSGNFTQTNTPTFSANSGVIAVSGNTTINAPNITFNRFTIATTGFNAITVAASTIVPLGADPTSTHVDGGVIISGTVSFTGTWTATSAGGSGFAAITLQAAGTISGNNTTAAITDMNWANNGGTLPTGFSVTMNRTTSAAGSFTGAGATYNTFRRIGSGSSTITFSGSNTFTTFRDNDGSVAHTNIMTAGTTQTITTFTVDGSSGKIVTFRSSSPNTAWTLTTSAGAKTCDYVVIQDSTVDASPTWTAGENSADGGGNTNWIFTQSGGGGGGGGGAQSGGFSFGPAQG